MPKRVLALQSAKVLTIHIVMIYKYFDWIISIFNKQLSLYECLFTSFTAAYIENKQSTNKYTLKRINIK